MSNEDSILEHRLTQLERQFEKLDRLRVAFMVAIALATIFGLSAGFVAYKTLEVWKFVSNGQMEVVLYTEQNGGKLVRVEHSGPNHRQLIADRDPADGASASNIFLLQDPSRYPLR